MIFWSSTLPELAWTTRQNFNHFVCCVPSDPAMPQVNAEPQVSVNAGPIDPPVQQTAHECDRDSLDEFFDKLAASEHVQTEDQSDQLEEDIDENLDVENLDEEEEEPVIDPALKLITMNYDEPFRGLPIDVAVRYVLNSTPLAKLPKGPKTSHRFTIMGNSQNFCNDGH